MSSILANIVVLLHCGTMKCLQMNQVNALNVFEKNVHTRMFFEITWVRVISEFDFSNIVSSATHNVKLSYTFTTDGPTDQNGNGNNLVISSNLFEVASAELEYQQEVSQFDSAYDHIFFRSR